MIQQGWAKFADKGLTYKTSVQMHQQLMTITNAENGNFQRKNFFVKVDFVLAKPKPGPSEKMIPAAPFKDSTEVEGCLISE